jgi:hypothetical protein
MIVSFRGLAEFEIWKVALIPQAHLELLEVVGWKTWMEDVVLVAERSAIGPIQSPTSGEPSATCLRVRNTTPYIIPTPV